MPLWSLVCLAMPRFPRNPPFWRDRHSWRLVCLLHAYRVDRGDGHIMIKIMGTGPGGDVSNWTLVDARRRSCDCSDKTSALVPGPTRSIRARQ
jgi:hypothetical protein